MASRLTSVTLLVARLSSLVWSVDGAAPVPAFEVLDEFVEEAEKGEVVEGMWQVAKSDSCV
jgi:hypothetical protein